MAYAGILAHGTSLTAAECARMIPQLSATSIRQAMRWAGDERRLAQACQAVLEFMQRHAIAASWGRAGFIGNSGKVVPSGWGHFSFETEKNRYLLAQRSAPGGDVYVLLYAMQETNYPTAVFQRTVELKPMQGAQVNVLDAAALQRGLEADGKVAVYGVHFDTAKAEVKPDSKASLDEMAKLLAKNPGMKVYIVGHTDNTGTLAANLDLSQKRADAVAKALASTYKVEPQRLAARGVASLAPVASNSGEEGRARNRRVELVVQ